MQRKAITEVVNVSQVHETVPKVVDNVSKVVDNPIEIVDAVSEEVEVMFDNIKLSCIEVSRERNDERKRIRSIIRDVESRVNSDSLKSWTNLSFGFARLIRAGGPFPHAQPRILFFFYYSFF